MSAERQLPPSVERWRARGHTVELAGLEVFTVDTGPADADDAVVVLHGFPSSSHDWHRVLPHLCRGGRRVVLFDLPGFGLSAKPEAYSYSLFEQADIVEMLLARLQVRSAQVLAHDMGTTVACEVMARRERGLLGITCRSLLLMNGSVHIEMTRLTPSQRILRTRLGPLFSRVASRRVFGWQMGRIVGEPLSEQDLDDMWAQMMYRGGKQRLPQTISYIAERWRFHRRWVGALTRLDIPTLVLWGDVDTVGVFAIAEQLHREIPGARLERLDGLGHYPQLEDAERTGAAMARWLDSNG